MNRFRSKQLFNKALQLIPGGVNSPVRAFGTVGGTPIFFDHAKEAYLFDVDGNQYIDYVGSWGPMIVGHAHPAVVHAVQKTAAKGLSFGAPCEAEVRLAERVCSLMPSIEKIRFVNSGTEAAMSAIRVARGFTKRNKLIKFNGCYHGHADYLLVKAGSGALTFGQPSSLGVTADNVKDTLIAEFNDLDSVEAHFKQHPDDIAGIILEPITGNMNCVLPKPGFLSGLKNLCEQYGALFICDEVMTGFRVAPGGAQELYDIKPDLSVLGKVIGGGMPVGAFGGRADVMSCLSPEGGVYQAGTLSGNPLAMAAGLATLALTSEPGFYEQLHQKTERFVNGLQQVADDAGIALKTVSVTGMFGFYFTDQASIDCMDNVLRCDKERYNQFFHAMLEQGVYFAPSSFEAGFMSMAHSDDVIDQTITAAKKSFKLLQ